ncbi:N-6 DNA methylase [Paracoccus sp. DMF-8]|uniref:HsdM family class I SAM-dependent methyltransferase n=1 Tax=Paracoccus sp. DMF-8 TaxID=3019445 RepID=UPI0023E82268|nr:N-6 DNA methylase [Paracoccus sp. DMF-8]MDF3605765.1 N-6 DNA methylase [Paracoccus sp. DMF-8]
MPRTEARRGGEFYTPKSIVSVLVEMLEPVSGRVYDPCCGTGGFFVQSEKFIRAHQGRVDDIAVYGQESSRDAPKARPRQPRHAPDLRQYRLEPRRHAGARCFPG